MPAVKNFLGQGKAGPGQPPHTPTDQTRLLVEMMSGCGIPQMQIAPTIGISDETLRKYYRRELDRGAIEANAKVAEALFRQAIGGNTAAAIWWTKCRMGWRERSGVEHSGSLSLSVPEWLDITVRTAAVSIENNGSE
jgi:hypothetical protein